MSNTHYLSANQYFISRFGQKAYKLALSGGMTCPNRDGTIGTRGCIFCSDGGSGEFAAKPCGDISAQIEQAKSLVRSKLRGEKFIAYFQSYTNTYASVDSLERLFMPCVLRDDICALSIGTRPDCLGEDVLELLSRLSKIKPVFVELGLQTVHERTAALIRRGYSLPVFDRAVRELKSIGVNVIVHIIVGLPGETPEMIVQSARYVGKSGADGVKLQLLHVLEGTDLADMYRNGEFDVLSLDAYAKIVADCIEALPESTVIHRITGDAPKRLLLAPKWSADKKHVLNYMNAYFDRRGLRQGSKL